MDSENSVNYRLFEKPSSSQVSLQEDTTLSRNSLVQSVAEDTKRRLMNNSRKVPDSVKVEMMDKWAQKLINSGHKSKEVRSILLSGIKGYNNKVKKCQKSGTPLHRSAKLSFIARRLAKLTGKSNWFRKPGTEDIELMTLTSPSRAL